MITADLVYLWYMNHRRQSPALRGVIYKALAPGSAMHPLSHKNMTPTYKIVTCLKFIKIQNESVAGQFYSFFYSFASVLCAYSPVAKRPGHLRLHHDDPPPPAPHASRSSIFHRHGSEASPTSDNSPAQALPTPETLQSTA